MITHTYDSGVLATLFQRMAHQRLPRALEIKARVDQGERLNDFDIRFLEQIFEDSRHARTLIVRHPEHQQLMAKAARLYWEITEQALHNERHAPAEVRVVAL